MSSEYTPSNSLARQASSVALIVAAGRGHRFGGEFPKQYLDLSGQPILRHTLIAFVSHPQISAVRTVIHPDDRAYYDVAAQGLDVLAPVHGGATRQDSVRLGLESLAEITPSHVLIHDSVRPLVDPVTISNVIGGLASDIAVLPALPVTDTLKRAADGTVSETVPRVGLWQAQTPQGFRFDEIMAAHHAAAGHELTDDAAVAEKFGLSVRLVEGDIKNIKITTSEDLSRATTILSGGVPDIRVGTGFDVHRFREGNSIMLCGIEIPHSYSLAGHSDADVGLHAITDAILGAIGAGDIGEHFPPSDPKWKDAASHMFLRDAARRVEERGGKILNVDLTLICEAPKISPYKERMAERVGEILQIARDRVNIKATTTEQLGFTGRGEGIAGQAVVSINL